MNALSILHIILAGFVALSVAMYMYGYKSKHSRFLRWVFGLLRFFTLFFLLVLLINPKITSNTYTIEKPKLPVLVDVSSSITELKQAAAVQDVIDKIKNNTALQEKFDIQFFSFGTTFKELDTLVFTETQTQIGNALKKSQLLFKNEDAPTVLITDGNQTFGSDYEFIALQNTNPIYPIVVGDTTKFQDLKIETLNSNRYSFLKNEFPVEAIIVYSGETSLTTQFEVKQGNKTVFLEKLNFSKSQNSKTISFKIPSTAVGLQRYSATVQPFSEEKNKTNNTRNFEVEVIDQATNVAIVSKYIHPDLGALKKAIEQNEQRNVTFLKPDEALLKLEEYQLFILYQPERSFSALYTELQRLNKNTWTISGLNTDWNFLNAVQNNFQKEASRALEDVNGSILVDYASYAVIDFGLSNYPPLQTEFGDLTITVPHETLIAQYVNGFKTDNAIYATMEINNIRHGIWDGEGLWKWRAHNYLEKENFKDFDDFIGKIVQYLASNKRRSRLEVTFETFYYNHNPITISSQYFDKSYVFDTRAQLEITLTHKETKKTSVYPMLLKNNEFIADLSALPQGDYNFTVKVVGDGISRSGSFSILDFNVEQQFLHANHIKLGRVATNTYGSLYFLNTADNFITEILRNDLYLPTQKSQQNIVSLIDWKYILFLIALLLALEWFIRKYNGLV